MIIRLTKSLPCGKNGKVPNFPVWVYEVYRTENGEYDCTELISYRTLDDFRKHFNGKRPRSWEQVEHLIPKEDLAINHSELRMLKFRNKYPEVQFLYETFK